MCAFMCCMTQSGVLAWGKGATSFHVFLLGGVGINDAQFEVDAGTIITPLIVQLYKTLFDLVFE